MITTGIDCLVGPIDINEIVLALYGAIKLKTRYGIEPYSQAILQ